MPSDEEEYQRRLRKRISEQLRMQQLEQQKREIMQRFLEAEAYERLMNIRSANQELYEQVVNLVISLVQTKRISGKMTDAQFRSVLERITARPDTKIDFKHK
ncbi:MAG: DNA-binding protein, partial [Candidatus Micrarchaeaceae archaeon]